MKNVRKAFALLLVLAVVLSLTGCSPITITRAAKNMSSVKSLRADMALDLDLGMAMMEETSEIAAAVTGPVELDLANGKGHGDISVDVMGQALSILFYYEDLKESYQFYVSLDGGETWSKNETPKDPENQTQSGGSKLKSIVELTRFAASFEETGTESVKGRDAVIYSGELPWAELLANADLSQAYEAAGSAGVPLDPGDLDFESLGSIPVTIGYDAENAMVVKASMDLTDTVRKLVPAVMKAVMKASMAESGMSAEDLEEMEDFDLSMLGIELDIRTLTVSTELYDFDAVGEIVIPPEALSAEALPSGALPIGAAA